LIGGAEILTGGGSYQQPYDPGPSARRTGTPTDEVGKFVAAVLGSADQTWKVVFEKEGGTYQRPRLVMFSGVTRSGCGVAQSAMGPFYCPPSREVYLDTSFFRDLERRFRGCSGEACKFAQAYVITHEVGHHVQNLLGILPRVQQAQQRASSRAEANQLQVRVELQADCFAGVWAHHAEQRWKVMQPGDIEAAMQTAAAIGDDMLQKRSQGYVVPDSFTHGSSAQRQRWFMTGFRQGTVRACNTFSTQAQL
jgi:predicted metalloprotease